MSASSFSRSVAVLLALLFGATAPVLAQSRAACITEATPAADVAASDIATFSESIDTDSVRRFIALHTDEHIRRVVLDSPGGDVVAGIALGNWILDRCADVQVRKRCASSCANYPFLAGRRKIIDDGAIVIWHGSALQKNFRERLADCSRRIGELAHAGGELADVYLRGLAAEEALCGAFTTMRDVQNAFFARVGASEYVTRMGQEPRSFDAIWTVSLAAMASLGITNVEAPANYGSHDYMKRFNQVDDPEPILVLGFDAEGHVVELAR